MKYVCEIIGEWDTQVSIYSDPCPRCIPLASKPIVYVAHPVGSSPVDNVFKTVDWIRWLTQNDPTRVYVAPWLGEVLAFPGTSDSDVNYRGSALALEDDLQVLAKFDEIILVGGRISPGMQKELNKAKQLKLRINDMSQYRNPGQLPEGFFLDPAMEN